MSTKVSEDRISIKRELSDRQCYETLLDCNSKVHIFSFKNEHFDEMKALVKYLTNVFEEKELKHEFIKDLCDIVTVLNTRICRNNWAICITEAELRGVVFRFNTLRDFIIDRTLPSLNSQVDHFGLYVFDKTIFNNY
jgi:hypothetical protein